MTGTDDEARGSDLVRALSRGLTLISVLNQHNGLTIRELATHAALPEPTTIRLLKTLAEEGYVVRSVTDRRFRLSRSARDLNSGYRVPTWIDSIARPVAERLQSALVWPVSVVALVDGRLWPCVFTDSRSGLVAKRSIGPVNFPVLTTAAGWVFLAFLPDDDSAALLAQSQREESASLSLHTLSDAAKGDRLAQIRADGHMVYRHLDDTVVSTPILYAKQIIGTLAVRHEQASPLSAAELDAYAKSLKQGAADIVAGLSATEPPGLHESAVTTQDPQRQS